MRVHQYEKAFLWLGAVMLGAFLIALLVTSVAAGIHLPGRAGEVDPLTINRVEPFDNPGVREVGPGRYEVVLLASAWSWNPAEIRVPAGSEVTFLAAATDVIHGLHISGTRVNMMLIPGQISRNTYRFEQPGEHLLICHEYCGAGHHLMSGKVIVE
ncbi:MAG: cytochrome c oxidase subunit II [Gemmatimonadales bacterium]|jgi:cytochrome c oxidase subunit 2